VNRLALAGLVLLALPASAAAQTVDLGAPSRAWADAQLAPYVCDSSQGVPGAAT
jgi:hypothetical protein